MSLLDGLLGNASQVDTTKLEAEFFSIETGRHFVLDAELKVWVSGSSVPFQRDSTSVSASTRFSRCSRRTFSNSR